MPDSLAEAGKSPGPEIDSELTATTESGERFVTLAEAHSAHFARRAAAHDRAGSFPFENWADLRQSGALAATAPAEFGGLGVESAHDLAVGVSRLARGDAATAIGLTMHLSAGLVLARTWRTAQTTGETPLANKLARLFRRIAAGEWVLCSALSERGADQFHPLSEGQRVDGGWRVSGRKTFATLSPVATHVYLNFRAPDGQGGYRRHNATLPRHAPGLELVETWDALGMRASGSHDLELRDVFVPDSAVEPGLPWGAWDASLLVTYLVSHLGLTGVALGIAEAARQVSLDRLAERRPAPAGRILAERYEVQHRVAENEFDLAAMRALLDRSGQLSDDCLSAYPCGGEPLDVMHALFKDFQCAKWFVQQTAITVVDRALTLTGGAGYLSDHPLSRLYRDVRALPFMPLAPTEAFEYIGKVALDLDPTLEG